MITNYRDFILNEGYTNPQKVYLIDKIKLRTQGEYSANPSLIDEDIKKFEDLFMVNMDDIIKKKDYSKYSTALKEFIKTKAYNKLIEIMYGKGYTNPEGDSTKIIVGLDPSSMASAMKYGSTPKTIEMTRGEYFKKVWARVDEYCDNSVEFLQKGGTIEDTLGDFVDYSKNALLIILAAVIIYFGAKAIAVGASGIGTFAASTAGLSAIRNIMSNAGVKSMTFIEKGALAIQRIVSNPNTWKGIASWEIFDAIPKIMEMFSSNDADVLLQLDEENVLKKLSSKNKKTQIAKIKKALEEHSDFNVKPFLDGPVQVWQEAFQRMPGWEAWSQKEGKSINNNPQNLGYVFTYYIALYTYQFQLFIWKYNYLLMLKEGRDNDFSKL